MADRNIKVLTPAANFDLLTLNEAKEMLGLLAGRYPVSSSSNRVIVSGARDSLERSGNCRRICVIGTHQGRRPRGQPRT